MNRLEDTLRQAIKDLDRSGRRWALVGGFAVSARTIPRFTRDIDMAVMVADDSAAEQLIREFLGDGYTLYATVEHDNGRLATVRLKRASGGLAVTIDLLFASSGIEPEVVQAAEVMEIAPGLSLPVSTAGHLIALKLLARDDETRPQDLADLRALLEVATDDDLVMARSGVELITARGYHRNRDLASALDEIVRVNRRLT